MNDLKRSVIVLHRRNDTDPSYTDGHGHVGLILSKRDYDDLGKPAEITITIEPGNTLS